MIPFIWASIPLLIVFGVWWVWHRSKSIVSDVSHAPPGAPAGAFFAPGAARGPLPKTPAEYALTFQPRIAGLAYTATRYDEQTKPTRVPFPAACIASKSRCSCSTQQATPLDMPDALCRSIVAHGYFQDFDPDPDTTREARAARLASLQAPPASAASSVALAGPSGFPMSPRPSMQVDASSPTDGMSATSNPRNPASPSRQVSP